MLFTKIQSGGHLGEPSDIASRRVFRTRGCGSEIWQAYREIGWDFESSGMNKGIR